MPVERQSPDAILEINNLSPNNVSYIQDDPDSPDANWLMPVANNVDTICRVSFPTPTGNPTQGAGLQEFRVWIKKWNGTGTPQCRIDLYENGVLLTSGTLTNVTNTTGQIKSFLWDASALSNADGSLVECYVFGDAVGGAPATRATVAIGAVEWNVEYEEEPPPPLSGGFGARYMSGAG